MTPRRIQMSRQHPWRAGHEDAVKVDRSTKWGNPGVIPGKPNAKNRQIAVDGFSFLIRSGQLGHDYEDRVRTELAGRDLACWCPLDQPCHADVLLALANGGV